MWGGRGFLAFGTFVALVLAFQGVVAGAETTNPIASLSVVSVVVLDLDGGGVADDLRVQIVVAVSVEEALDLTFRMRTPSGVLVEVDRGVDLEGPGIFHLTVVLLNEAQEAGWYVLWAVGEYVDSEVLSHPFPFDPAGGSIGPSGE